MGIISDKISTPLSCNGWLSGDISTSGSREWPGTTT
jgi:hypothetical protein